VHWRLRVRPQADTTLTATGQRDDLLRVGRDALNAVRTPAALEIFGPRAGSEWTLAIRLIGTAASVAADRRGVGGLCPNEGKADLWQGGNVPGAP